MRLRASGQAARGNRDWVMVQETVAALLRAMERVEAALCGLPEGAAAVRQRSRVLALGL